MTILLQNKWNPKLYDSEFSSISTNGIKLLNLLNPKCHEKILDLGCGTGDLTMEIMKRTEYVNGFDSSKEMIIEARTKYPEIDFKIKNAEENFGENHFDGIISNSVLHWILNPNYAIENISNALKPNGRLVFEQFTKGNLFNLISALTETLISKESINGDLNPWFTPTIGEVSTILEKNNLEIIYAINFENQASFIDGKKRIGLWLQMFMQNIFDGLSLSEKEELLNEIISNLPPSEYKDGVWRPLYKKIRILAVKKAQ